MTPAIECEHVEKRFGDVVAVSEVSFAVARGATCALLGGNGAGKTTTLSMLLGVLLPSSGAVRVLGEDMVAHRYRVIERMNFTSPYVDLPKKLSVVENLMVFANLYGVRKPRGRVNELIERLELESLAGRAYGTLSAGQRTRVSIAKSLLNRPDVLLLDEPTASLDPDMGDRVRTQLETYRRESGATLLLASHNMLEVERLCDQVLMMRAGRIVDAGSPTQLIERYGRATMEEVFLDVARNADAGNATAASP